jgi:hypothetical protein
VRLNRVKSKTKCSHGFARTLRIHADRNLLKQKIKRIKGVMDEGPSPALGRVFVQNQNASNLPTKNAAEGVRIHASRQPFSSDPAFAFESVRIRSIRVNPCEHLLVICFRKISNKNGLAFREAVCIFVRTD